MPRKLCIAAGLVLAWSSLAGAQTAPRPETPATAAAMERAKRAAEGPMRAILQASKAPLRRKAGEAEAPAAAASAAAPEPTEPTVQRVALARTRPGGDAAGGTEAGSSAAGAGEAVVPPPVPQGVVTSLVLPASALAAPAGGEVAALAPSAQGRATASLSQMVVAQPLLTALPAVALQPRLLNMVEPNIPPRLRDLVPGTTEVQADLMLRADGTVAEVVLVPPVPRTWQRLLVVALEQWRFEPLAAARSHRVQLVFGEP